MSMVSNANLRNLSFLSLASACALAAPPDPGLDPCSLPDMNDMLLHEPACALGGVSVRPNRLEPKVMVTFGVRDVDPRTSMFQKISMDGIEISTVLGIEETGGTIWEAAMGMDEASVRWSRCFPLHWR